MATAGTETAAETWTAGPAVTPAMFAPAAAKTAPETGATEAAKAGPTKAGPTEAGSTEARTTEPAEKSTRHLCFSFPHQTIKLLDTTDSRDVNQIDG
jgi:hypothetical protein